MTSVYTKSSLRSYAESSAYTAQTLRRYVLLHSVLEEEIPGRSAGDADCQSCSEVWQDAVKGSRADAVTYDTMAVGAGRHN